MDSEKEKEWKEIQEAVKKADRKAIDGMYIARIELVKKKEKEVK